jgi:hypothetical protein
MSVTIRSDGMAAWSPTEGVDRGFRTISRAQDLSQAGTLSFREALQNTETEVDRLERFVDATPLPTDPTGSPLYQSHLGSTTQGQISRDGSGSSDDWVPYRVIGVNATTSASLFSSEQPLSSERFLLQNPDSESLQAAQPSTSGYEDFSGIYDAQTGRVTHRLGTRFDARS